MSREDIERGEGRGVKSRGNNSNSYLSPSTYSIEDTEAHYWTSWLIPMFVVANVAVFIVVMYINNCPTHLHTRLEGKCVARFLGRFSCEPLKDNPLFGPSSATLERLGALEWTKVVDKHQGWRLITCIWLHAGIIHLLANMLSLVFIGIRLEQQFGFVRIGVVYLLSGFGGSLLSSLFIRNNISVGASGALFGLLGSMLSELITNWSIYTNKAAALLTLLFIIAINLAIGILPHVDNFAHVGGFLFLPTTAKFPLHHHQTTFEITHSIHTAPESPGIIALATKITNPTTPDPNSNAMDPNPFNEEFVNIENPGNNVNHLSESIVDVANELSEYDNKNDDVVERMELPEELSRSVMVLTCESKAVGGTCVVHLVGTAHVSQESCREVQAVISYLKPQVVFLELCASRVAVLSPQNLKVPTMGEMIEMWKKNHNAFGILYSWFLAKVADKLEVFPGSEFRVAFEEARKYEGKVVLGDRPVHITLQRTWGKMPVWHKVKLLYSLLFQALFLPSSEDLEKMLKEMDDVDMLTLVIQEMSKQFPTLMETLVKERDQYMSSTLLSIAKEHNSVVAVVGKGHLQGIKRHWEQRIELKDLMELPSQKPAVSARKVLASLGVAVAGAAIVSGIYLSRKK